MRPPRINITQPIEREREREREREYVCEREIKREREKERKREREKERESENEWRVYCGPIPAWLLFFCIPLEPRVE